MQGGRQCSAVEGNFDDRRNMDEYRPRDELQVVEGWPNDVAAKCSAAAKAGQVDEALKARVEAIHEEAMVLTTEEYFVRLIEDKFDGMIRKLILRQCQIIGKYEYTEVHRIIRERVEHIANL